jgi:hypothetical protein
MKTIADGPGPANRPSDSAPAGGTKSTLSSLGEGFKLFTIAVIVLVLVIKFNFLRLLKRKPR